MELAKATNHELIANLLELRAKERRITVALLYYLIEVENRKLYAELGFSSMFDFCTRKLGYSESGAYRRIAACRALKEKPELKGFLLEGKLTLCTVATAAQSLKANQTRPQDLAGKSKREVEKLVAKEMPRPKESIKPLIAEFKALPLVPAPAPQDRYQIKFSVCREVYEMFEEAKNRLSNSLPSLSVEAVFEKLLKHYLKPQTKKGLDVSSSRYVPRSVKREVYQRDQGQCSYISPDGTRCLEKRYLQFDHIDPFTLGGQTKASNLRLLCPAHNQLLARQLFGQPPPVAVNHPV